MSVITDCHVKARNGVLNLSRTNPVNVSRDEKPNAEILPLSLSVTHTRRSTHPWIPAVHLPSVNTTYLPQTLNDCLHCTSRSLQEEIDHTHDIRNEMACHMELFSLPLLKKGARATPQVRRVKAPWQVGLLWICSRFGTHATVLSERWMTINHLIYERDSLSVACFLTCNNITTPQQLRKNPRGGCRRRQL